MILREKQTYMKTCYSRSIHLPLIKVSHFKGDALTQFKDSRITCYNAKDTHVRYGEKGGIDIDNYELHNAVV